MINEIKRRLNIGETVDLECIDWNKFSRSLLQRTSGRKFTEIVIESVDDDNQTLILDSGVKLLFSELKYFKIKDQMPTFNDLINVAVQAHKDRLLKSIAIENCSILITKNDFGKIYCKKGSDSYSEAINLVNSLYTETFVIDCEKDIEKICDDAEITLASGERGIFNSVSGLRSITNEKTGAEVMGINIFWLKGATVTQRKDNESKY